MNLGASVPGMWLILLGITLASLVGLRRRPVKPDVHLAGRLGIALASLVGLRLEEVLLVVLLGDADSELA